MVLTAEGVLVIAKDMIIPAKKNGRLRTI